jgi:hypothetical protein
MSVMGNDCEAVSFVLSPNRQVGSVSFSESKRMLCQEIFPLCFVRISPFSLLDFHCNPLHCTSLTISGDLYEVSLTYILNKNFF